MRGRAQRTRGDLAEVVYELGRHEEAFAIAQELRTNPPGQDVQALLNHLAETYSLSDRLIRNRRVVVGVDGSPHSDLIDPAGEM